MYEISSYMKTFFGSMYEISSCYDRGFLIDEIMLYLIMYELFHDPYHEEEEKEREGAHSGDSLRLRIPTGDLCTAPCVVRLVDQSSV